MKFKLNPLKLVKIFQFLFSVYQQGHEQGFWTDGGYVSIPNQLVGSPVVSFDERVSTAENLDKLSRLLRSKGENRTT